MPKRRYMVTQTVYRLSLPPLKRLLTKIQTDKAYVPLDLSDILYTLFQYIQIQACAGLYGFFVQYDRPIYAADTDTDCDIAIRIKCNCFFLNQKRYKIFSPL